MIPDRINQSAVRRNQARFDRLRQQLATPIFQPARGDLAVDLSQQRRLRQAKILERHRASEFRQQFGVDRAQVLMALMAAS